MGVRAIVVGLLRCNCLVWRDSRGLTTLWKHKQSPSMRKVCQGLHAITNTLRRLKLSTALVIGVQALAVNIMFISADVQHLLPGYVR
jgi:hypothetical protein